MQRPNITSSFYLCTQLAHTVWNPQHNVLDTSTAASSSQHGSNKIHRTQTGKCDTSLWEKFSNVKLIGAHSEGNAREKKHLWFKKLTQSKLLHTSLFKALAIIFVLLNFRKVQSSAMREVFSEYWHGRGLTRNIK